MNVDNHALIRSYQNILTEASTPVTLQFGKYKLIKAPQSVVTQEPYDQACRNKLISGQLKLHLSTMEDLGFKFNYAYRIEPYGYTSNKPDYVILGEDPDGKPFAYSKKANVTGDAFLYYENSKHFANEIFNQFAERNKHNIFDEQTLLNKWVTGSWSVDKGGGIRVKGDLNIAAFRVGYRVADFAELPIKFNSVSGMVRCSNQKLKTLTNFPKIISTDCRVTHLPNLESLAGWDGAQVGNLTINDCPNLTSLKGIPAVINLDCSISRCNKLNNISDIKMIYRNLNLINCPNIGNKQYEEAYIGDKVKGEIVITDYNSSKILDKRRYKKAWLDVLRDDETGLDLTF